MYCVKCGQKLAEGSAFCHKCGTETGIHNHASYNDTVYEGKEHKCVRCGASVGAFDAECPSCGFEIRDRKTAEAVSDFFNRVDSAISDEHRVRLIRNYPIPSTKEDVFEFINLASTNIIGELQEELFLAWVAKFNQCFQKAEALFENEEDFKAIKRIYDDTQKRISNERTKRNVTKIAQYMIEFTKWVYSIFKNVYDAVNIVSNPIVAIVAVLLSGYEVFRVVSGQFLVSDIIAILLVLFVVNLVINKMSSFGDKE